MRRRLPENVREYGETAVVYVAAGLVLATLGEVAFFVRFTQSLDGGAGGQTAAPLWSAVVSLGQTGRVLVATAAGATALAVVERRTGLDVTGDSERRVRVLWALVGTVFAEAGIAVLVTLWTLGLFG